MNDNNTQVLALDGGEPIRKNAPLPHEWCGAHYIDQDEIDAASRVLKARSPFRYYGFDLQHEVDKLEEEFTAYIGRKYAMGTASGTAALQAALGALGVGFGDEVILPGYFWVATVASVVRSGAVPVLVDSDETFSIDPDKVEEKITERTKAIITVHMGGVIGNVDKLVEVAKKHDLKIIEDCAQCTGGWQNGKKAGAFGDMAIYSFQLNKHMTSGEGGMLVTDDYDLYRRAFAIHDLGFPRNAEGRLEFDDPAFQCWGIGARMSELSGAVARVQFAKLDKICGNMRNSKNRIKEAIADIPGITPRKVLDPSGDAGSFLYLTLETREKSLKLVDALKAEGIIGEDGGMYPIHMDDWGLHIYYNIPSLVNKRGNSAISVWDLKDNAASDVSYNKGTCPYLDSLLDKTMIICIASTLTEKDEDDIIAAIRKVAGHIL